MHRGTGRLILVAALAGALAACSSMPVPKGKDDALLIVLAVNPTGRGQSTDWADIVTVAGPTPLQLRLGMEGRRLLFQRVRPGAYTFSQRALRIRDSESETAVPGPTPIEVGPATVTLCPVVLTHWVEADGRARSGSRVITPDDQRTVTAEISDYLRFGEWIGTRFVGFGPYRPRFSLEKDSYPYGIATRPDGARLLVDGQDFGTTPLTAELAPGRHQLSVEKTGFAITKTYVAVESEGEITIPLTPLAGVKEATQPGASRILIAPFRNLAPPAGDELGAVLDDSLEIGLGAAPAGLEPIRAAAAAARPDFAAAESAGADLTAVGSYFVQGDRLLVQAELYDVPTRMARASVAYSGLAGLAMFKGIDGMVDDLAKGARRELPQPGETIVARTDRLQSLAYDRKRTEQEVIGKRQERKTSLAVHGFLGGEFDTIDDPPVFNDDMRLQTGGPAMGVGATVERDLRGPLSVALMFNPLLTPATDRAEGLLWELPVYLGPRYTFAGYRTDLYWGLLGEARYVGAMKVDDAGTTHEYGPYWIGGVAFDTGLKLYTYERMSKPARFVSLGMMISIFGLRMTTDMSETARVPLALWMYAGLGGRL